MAAVVQARYGSAAELRSAEVGLPVINDREVLVRVRAAGLDRGTWHLMTGRPYLVRLFMGLRGPRQRVPGLDLAGTVLEVGARVTRFAVGDEVFGIGRGSFAEYAAAREGKLALRPATVDPTAAAVLGVSGLTALQALRDTGRLRPGQHVLIVGASGGVGTFAVQIAHALGGEVTAVCSGAKADLVRSIGADHVIDYTREDVIAGSRRYDLIVDIGGSSPVPRLRSVLTPRGTLVIVGGEGGNRWTGVLARQLHAAVLNPFVRQRLSMMISSENHRDLEELARLVVAGDLTSVVDSVHPLAEVPTAMRRLESGQVRGKLAVKVAETGRALNSL